MIGILVPMQEEIELLIRHMHVSEKVENGMRTYYCGKIEGKDCVIALSRIGKVASAVTAAFMVNHFKVNTLIVAGVAGGIGKNVRVGDICIATEAVQHDMDASGFFPRFEIPLLGITKFEADSKLIEIAKKSAEHFLEFEKKYVISEEYNQKFALQNIKIHAGLLGSGDVFIGSKTKSDELLYHFSDMVFVEMEGAAVAQIAYEHSVKLLNIRIISDNANDEAIIDFKEFIDHAAKFMMLGLVKEVVKNID